MYFYNAHMHSAFHPPYCSNTYMESLLLMYLFTAGLGGEAFIIYLFTYFVKMTGLHKRNACKRAPPYTRTYIHSYIQAIQRQIR